jgi:hypothetical protein
MKYTIIVLAFLFVGATSSCRKDTDTAFDGNWLFPIAKGDLSMNSLSELKNLDYHIQIPALSIGQPVNFPVTSPGLQLKYVGPFGVQITDWLKRVDIDSLEFSGTLNNFFPIPIGAGTKVTMRTTRDTNSSNIAGVALIPAQVPPGGLFSFDIKVTKKTLNDSVFFFLDDFNSPAYSNVVFSSSPTKLDIRLKVITADYAEIYTNRNFYSVDTADFSAGSKDNLSSGSNGSVSDTSVSGTINVFLDNSLPANVVAQLYFLDVTRTQIIDSLFAPNLKTGGSGTDPAGNPLNTISSKTTVPVTRKKVDNIKKASYVVSRFNFNTFGFPGAFVAVNRLPHLSVQFTGDLDIKIKF